MNILIINYYYAPTTDAHAYRWMQIAKHYTKQGYFVEVLTGKVANTPREEILDGVKVKRIGLIEKKPIDVLNQVPASLLSCIKLSIINFFRPLYRKLYWPDASWHWAPSVLFEMIARRNIKYDLVVSYYPCFSAHIAGSFLKKISQYPDFKWVIDYGDPFCASDTWQPNNYYLYDRLNRKVERSYADLGNIVLTNDETRNSYLNKLGSDISISLIPHLVDLDIFYSNNYVHQVRSGGEIHFLYIGAFHPGIREPHRLIELVRELNKHRYQKVYLDMYGPANGFNFNSIDSPEIRHSGYIDRKLAIECLKNADFIVNVDNYNCVMTPSKIVECIATGRPIINVANPEVRYAPLKKYEDLGYAISINEKYLDDAVLKRLEIFLKLHIDGYTAPKEVVESILSSHLLPKVAQNYLDL